MRYHYNLKTSQKPLYGQIYICKHPVYDKCTLFKFGDKGLAIIQQRFNKLNKTTWWSYVDPGLINDIFRNKYFMEYFNENASIDTNGLYPTVTVRKIMWALRMKPLPKERWETVFDRKTI